MSNNRNTNANSQQVTKSESKSPTPAAQVNGVSVKVSKDLVAAAGFNVETPIVNALIGNLTGTLPNKKSEVEPVRCDICDCELSSNVILDFHLNGAKHRKKLKALEIIEQLKAGGNKGIQVGENDNPNAFRCDVCSLTVNSAMQLEIHLSGSKHRKKAIKAGLIEPDEDDKEKEKDKDKDKDKEKDKDKVGENPGVLPEEMNSPPAPKKKKKEEAKLVACDVCNVIMNSQIQYEQHLASKKHMFKANSANPRKPKGWLKSRFIQFKSAGPPQRFPFNHNNNFNARPQYNPSQNYRKGMFPFPNYVPNNPNNHSYRPPFNNSSNNNMMNNMNNSNPLRPPFRNYKTYQPKNRNIDHRNGGGNFGQQKSKF